MNTLIKRSMKLGLSALFISAAIVPACAQWLKPIKAPKVTPKTGGTSSAVVKTPKVPVITPGTYRHQVKVPGSTAWYAVGTSSSAIPQLPVQVQNNVMVRVTPKASVALTDAQVRDRLQKAENFVRFGELNFITATSAAYNWLRDNPGKSLTDNPVLKEKLEQFLHEKNGKTSLANTPLVPLVEKLLSKDKNISTKSFVQLLEETSVYPHQIKLNEFGFPSKRSSKAAELDVYLLAADPIEMGAFAMNPNLLDSAEVRQSGLFLSEADRVAAETLIEKRLERLATIPAELSSPQEVLQVAYDYFVTQQNLTKGKTNFAYRYRAELPFEELTTAEKEGFIVHKLIRYQFKVYDPEALRKLIRVGMANPDMYMRWSTDIAHLRLLDYVASKNSGSILDETGDIYGTQDGLRVVLEAYQDLRTVSTRWTTYYGHDWLNNDVVKRAVELMDVDFYKLSVEQQRGLYHLLPQEIKHNYASILK